MGRGAGGVEGAHVWCRGADLHRDALAHHGAHHARHEGAAPAKAAEQSGFARSLRAAYPRIRRDSNAECSADPSSPAAGYGPGKEARVSARFGVAFYILNGDAADTKNYTAVQQPGRRGGGNLVGGGALSDVNADGGGGVPWAHACAGRRTAIASD